MKLTLEQRTSRMQNLKSAAVDNRAFGRRMYIHNLLAGHTEYILSAAAPNHDDFDRLQSLSAMGVDVLHLKAENYNAENVKRFTDLCHYFNLRVILPVTDWNGAPGAQWRHDVQPAILNTIDTMGFDGICADMSGLTGNTAAHDPELEDMLWHLYTKIKSRGGILVLRTCDDQEPPCIDQVYDYLMVNSATPMIQTQGFVLPENADSFAACIPYLQMPVLTQANAEAWQKYRALYAPMIQDVTLAYLDLQDCSDIVSPLTEGVHGSMFINDVKYLAVSNLSDKPYTLELKEPWTDRDTNVNAKVFAVQPGQLLLLAK